jgi:PAS domain S-box-containing protein
VAIKRFGLSRVRAALLFLLLCAVLVPWCMERHLATHPYPWQRVLTESLILAGIVMLVLLVARREDRIRQEVERRYREFFDRAPLAAYTLDRDGCFNYANRKLAEISGYPQEELVGRHWREFVLPEDVPLAEAKIAAAYGGGRDGLEPFVVRIYHADGQILHLKLDYTLLERSGVPAGFLVLAQDVSRRQALEAQLIKSERMAVAGQLAMGLAHEINNPLAIIKTSLRLLQERDGSGEGIGDTVRDIQEEVDRIAGLVRVLLGFRDERPGEDLVTTVEEAVQSLLHLMGPQIRQTGVDTEFSWAGGEVQAAIRPSQFRQVFFNLVRNALEAMPGGGKLQLAGEIQGETVSIRVRDTGRGISRKDQHVVFEPFFSTKSSGHHGLGLYVCYTILKSVGGDIEVESAPGEGSTFAVRIPLVAGR